MENTVVHWEFGARDPEKLSDFFTGLFGWRIEKHPAMEYRVVHTQNKLGINGGIAPVGADDPPFLTFYVVVKDLDTTLIRARDLGAKTVVPPTMIPGVGTFARIADPQGFVVGAIQPPPDWGEQSAPPREDAGGDPVMHWEIGSGEPAELHGFYATLFGWRIDTDTPQNYPMVQSAGEFGINGGIYEAELPEHRFLAIYVRVEDLAATLKKAESLGAAYVADIVTVPGIGSFSILQDLEGLPIGVMEDE